MPIQIAVALYGCFLLLSVTDLVRDLGTLARTRKRTDGRRKSDRRTKKK